MEKVMIGKTLPSPAPTVIVGALVNDRENYLTIGGYGGMSINPPLLYITLNKAHYTNAGIKENSCFSVNLPSAGLVQKTDYVGLVSGRDTDKSGVFTPFYGRVNKAPMIKECPVNILCEVYNVIDLPNNDVFIGEVLETYVDGDCMAGKVLNPKKINPLILMGGSYWELGNVAGAAFKEGRALIKK